ncbi:hypothetical protein HZB60_03190 [candidate division KSB1 bacterium]|nr:hypothetical protein [candidate division KSB1 bacterium]
MIAPGKSIPLWRNRPYLYASLALVALALFYNLIRPWGMEEDYWETTAAVRAVAEHPLHPVNPLIGLGEHTSPRFVPYTIVWGVFMRLTGLDQLTVMLFAALTNLVILLSGVYRFVSRQWRRTDLPLYALGAMLLLWGKGYTQANAYQLELLLVSLPFTGIFAFAVCFHALASLRSYLDERRWSGLLGFALLSVIVFISHPITALFAFAGGFAMLLAERRWGQVIGLQAVPLLALGAALVWPYFDYWTVLFKGSTESWFYMPMFSNRPLAIGTAFVGAPVLAYFAWRREQLFLVYAAILCGIAYLVSDVLQVLIGARFLFWMMVYVQIAVAIFALDRGLLKWSRLRESLRGDGLVFILVFVVLLPCLAFRVNELRKYAMLGIREDQSGEPSTRVADPFFFLAQSLKPHEIVMADLISGWPVPAISGARLVAQAKGNPLMQPEIERRRRDVLAFYETPLTLEQRSRTLRQYQCTHILWSDLEAEHWDARLRGQLDTLGERVVSAGPVTLYRVTLPAISTP